MTKVTIVYLSNTYEQLDSYTFIARDLHEYNVGLVKAVIKAPYRTLHLYIEVNGSLSVKCGFTGYYPLLAKPPLQRYPAKS